MGLHDDGEPDRLPPPNPRIGLATSPIRSLNEAWFEALDRCVIDTPLRGLILPLMRTCFFSGATLALFLLQKGHGDQLAVDIASFIREPPQS
jgi:hypothetical protein